MKLMPTKHQRCAYDRKLLVPYDVIGYIRQKLEARNLMTFPHYRPILHTLQQRKSLCSPCQFHQLEYICQFSTDNIAANCQLEVQGSLVASISQQSQQLKMLVWSWTLITKTKKLAFGWHIHKLLCDISNRNLQPFLPDPFPQQDFDSVHNLWDHCCGACKLSKVDLHVHAPFGDFPVATGGLMHAYVNIVNHFLTSDVQQYLLPIIEYFTLWPGATPISYTSADTVALAFVTVQKACQILWHSSSPSSPKRYGSVTALNFEGGSSLPQQSKDYCTPPHTSQPPLVSRQTSTLQ
ncbi:uncharacterized protein LOC126457788 [Schistocerca serialis cubense]|uniref:uncharacterized protein LOC126457788 n=1 Tax=Schistocerca serialis cubense TaxID=2023355 RepID=UPI00214F20DB|nr:uncharacterized protein LOC126457788 [Schistocerca serialis cubense]